MNDMLKSNKHKLFRQQVGALSLVLVLTLVAFFFVEEIVSSGLRAEARHTLDLTKARIELDLQRVFDGRQVIIGSSAQYAQINDIGEYIVKINIVEGGYGILLDQNFRVIAHPDDNQINRSLLQTDGGMRVLYDDMLLGEDIIGRGVRNYTGDRTVVFTRTLNNGWHIMMVSPYFEYYASIMQIAFIFFWIAAVMSALVLISLGFAAANNKLDEENIQKSGFLASMSHEIRTPLNVIMGLTELQMQDEGHRKSTFEALNQIHASGKTLLGIINDILDFSKIEAGKMELIPIEYDVASLINDTVSLNMILLESKPIEFVLHVDENLPKTFKGDILRIKQVLNNLLNNAFKYTAEGEVHLHVELEPEFVLVMRISDTGQGMSKEQLEEIFEEFSRFNLDSNNRIEGTGLGMSITKRLIDMMNGEIAIESTLGEGTVFTVKLPQVDVGAEVMGSEMAESLEKFRFRSLDESSRIQIVREPMPYGSVLIVDDVETNLYVASGLLVPYGLKIDTAINGYEALKKIRVGNVYDIIFMDHMMPGMDGIETASAIRKLGYNHPIVALTANAVVGQSEVFLNHGFAEFIPKPIDIRELNASLNRLIRDKQPPEVIEEARKAADKLRSESSPDVCPQLAKVFALDAEKTIAVLEAVSKKQFNCDDEDINLFTISVHAMKSALAVMGENQLSEMARRLEQLGRDSDINNILTETPAFLTALYQVVAKIREADTEDADAVDGDEDFLDDMLKAIVKACEDYDKQAVKAILTELRTFRWWRKTTEMLDKIAELLLHSEFEEIIELVG